MVRLLAPSRSVRCLVFHDIAATETPFTKGLGVTIRPQEFENTLSFIKSHYTAISLQDLLAAGAAGLPPRPLLVTFDDAYASVAEIAAPLCRKFGIPVVFFVNAAFLDSRRLALPNLVCYVANLFGMETIHAAARAVKGAGLPRIEILSDLSRHFLAVASLEERQAFVASLVRLAGIDECRAAHTAGLYITSKQLREMAADGVEIGNHTYTHVHCRCLSRSNFGREIDENKVQLEAVTGRPVRAFSVPYGSSQDLTGELREHLRATGHEAIFLSENAVNRPGASRFVLDRVSTRGGGEFGLFRDLEVLPRLRLIRNGLLRRPESPAR